MEHLNRNGRVKYIVNGFMVQLEYMMQSKLPDQLLKAMERAADKLKIIMDIRDICDDLPAVLEAVNEASNIICMVDDNVRNLVNESKGVMNQAPNAIVNDASIGIVNAAAAELPVIQPVNEQQNVNGNIEVLLEEDEEDWSDESFDTFASYDSSDYFTETSGFVSDDTYEMTDSSLGSEYSELDESFNL